MNQTPSKNHFLQSRVTLLTLLSIFLFLLITAFIFCLTTLFNNYSPSTFKTQIFSKKEKGYIYSLLQTLEKHQQIGIISIKNQEHGGSMVSGVIKGLKPGKKHGLLILENLNSLILKEDSVNSTTNYFALNNFHFNPTKSKIHSCSDNDKNRHMGDLGNIMANQDGNAEISKFFPPMKMELLFGRPIILLKTEDSCEEERMEESWENVLAVGILGVESTNEEENVIYEELEKKNIVKKNLDIDYMEKIRRSNKGENYEAKEIPKGSKDIMPILINLNLEKNETGINLKEKNDSIIDGNSSFLKKKGIEMNNLNSFSLKIKNQSNDEKSENKINQNISNGSSNILNELSNPASVEPNLTIFSSLENMKSNIRNLQPNNTQANNLFSSSMSNDSLSNNDRLIENPISTMEIPETVSQPAKSIFSENPPSKPENLMLSISNFSTLSMMNHNIQNLQSHDTNTTHLLLSSISNESSNNNDSLISKSSSLEMEKPEIISQSEKSIFSDTPTNPNNKEILDSQNKISTLLEKTKSDFESPDKPPVYKRRGRFSRAKNAENEANFEIPTIIHKVKSHLSQNLSPASEFKSNNNPVLKPVSHMSANANRLSLHQEMKGNNEIDDQEIKNREYDGNNRKGYYLRFKNKNLAH